MVACIFILFGEVAVLRFLSMTEIIGHLSKWDLTDDSSWEENVHFNMAMMAKTFEFKLCQI
jgi:hypothetical protein